MAGSAVSPAAAAMFSGDRLAAALGIAVEAAANGSATLTMTVREDMVQGHETCHGGALFTLADTAFALACNSYNERVVAQMCSITYVSPARLGDQLVATAVERSRRGRSGLYDITVRRRDGEIVAEFRGNSRSIGGKLVE